MAFFKLCSDDPVVSELREIFKANILRIPEERIVPLTILISSKGAVQFLGHIGTLMTGDMFETPPADLKESNMATMANRRSRSLDSEIGLQILSGLLAGMDGNSVSGIAAHFREVKDFRFHFPIVQRRYVELARIGQLLIGRCFDRTNLLFKTLLDPETTVRLIDSVITATDFEIEASDEGEANLKIDVPGLQLALAETKIGLTANDSKHLSFRSTRRLTFAFTCVTVVIAANGAIRAIAPFTGKVPSPQLPDPRVRDRGLEDHVLLTRAPELIDLEPFR